MVKKPTYEELEQRIRELKLKSLEPKEAEEARQKSEEKYRLLAESLLDAVYESDLEGKFLYVNKAAARMFGYSKDEVLNGLRVEDVIVEEDKAASRKAIRDVLKGNTAVGERTFIRKDRTTFIGEIRSSPLYKGENVVGTRGVLRDITESKRAVEEIRKLGTAVEQSIDGISVGDLEEKVTYVNEAFAAMHGYSREEMVGMKIMDLHSEEQRDEYKIDMHQIKTQGSWIGEVDHIRKDATSFPTYMSVTLLKDEKGKPTGILAVCRDITERKREQEALRESEEKYRALFENANDAILLADTKTNIILDANRQAERLIGRPREEIIGMHQVQLHPPRQAHYYEEKFRSHVEKGRVFDLEAEVITKDGRIVPVSISANVISLYGKEVIQGLFRDATEEKRIQDLTEKMEARRLIEKAKGVLMHRHNISEKEAMRRLQKESRRQRKKIKELAQAVISSELPNFL
jgi:PAS domain S-box-containing protein